MEGRGEQHLFPKILSASNDPQTTMLLNATIRTTMCLFACTLMTAFSAQAQDRFYPLDHRAPTGTAGRWNALTRPGSAGLPQQIRVILPSTGTVTFYSGGPGNQIPIASPAQLGVAVGFVYRMRISNLPEYPGVELFPTVEVIDRLNPPPGLEYEFPVPIELTEEEIEIAMSDRMVTKVVYLEQPDLAHPVVQTGGIRHERLNAQENLLKAADQRGRPLAIIRIGGRIPDPRSPSDEFFSQSPLWVNTP